MNHQSDNNVSALEPLGRRARKALAVRQALFEAGLAAFERQPIGLVSILDITEAADVAKGVFYLQFKSKDDYLLVLWEEVQQRFLDSLRETIMRSRSQNARAASAANHFKTFANETPAAARFWIRMSSYFPDEVGPPGHLTRIREAYHVSLASILSGKNSDKLSSRDVHRAVALDAICWAIVVTEFHSEELHIDGKKFVAAAQAALRSV